MEDKHSRLGIASFVLGILLLLLTFTLLAVAGHMQANTPGGIDQTSSEAIILGLLIIATIFMDFVALILGICGLVQKQRKKIFAILGTAFSGLLFVGTIAIIVLGNAMNTAAA